MEYSELHGQYRIEKTLGCGGFAKVKLATHLLTGENVAIKVMQKQALMEDLPRVKHEINALKSLSHTNICKLFQIIETNTHYFLVMEYCCGGELFDHIVEKEKLSEYEARIFFRQIVSAVSYLHTQGFTHRDLKPENILLDKNQNLKLIDFGLSVKPERGLDVFLNTFCGSPNYAAPELIKCENYLGPEIDVWSLGVLLYALLCGSLPFEDESIQKLYEKILSGQYEEKKWLSYESKSLLNSLLQVNAEKRITTKKLLSHPWFKKVSETVDVGHYIPKLIHDQEILKLMSQHNNMTPDELWEEIKKEKYDYLMATYLILFEKKRNNEQLVLRTYFSTPRKRTLLESTRQTRSSKYCKENNNDTVKRTDTFVLQKGKEGQTKKANNQPNRRNCKRLRSPGIGERCGPEAKRIKECKTPITTNSSISTKTPTSAKKILVGLEKSFNKAKQVFTPRRKNLSSENFQPVILIGKDLCNVSSTNSHSPDKVLAQLQGALKAKGIICTQKGYTLKGKLQQLSNDKKIDKLSFELEVCWIPTMSGPKFKNCDKEKSVDLMENAVVGIRRKRLQGDAWIYKNVCEEVLALAAPFKKQ